MKFIVWLLIGVGLGFIVAHKVNQTPAGKKFFADLDATTKGLTDAVVAGYKAKESELRDNSRAAA